MAQILGTARTQHQTILRIYRVHTQRQVITLALEHHPESWACPSESVLAAACGSRAMRVVVGGTTESGPETPPLPQRTAVESSPLR